MEMWTATLAWLIRRFFFLHLAVVLVIVVRVTAVIVVVITAVFVVVVVSKAIFINVVAV